MSIQQLYEKPGNALKKSFASAPNSGMCGIDLGDQMSEGWHVNDTQDLRSLNSGHWTTNVGQARMFEEHFAFYSVFSQ